MIDDFLKRLEGRGDLSVSARNALQGAKGKVGFVFAAFRDGTADAELVQNLTLFVQKLQASELAGAAAVRKQCIISHMAKCRDVVLFMNYVSNPLK
jgi:hypothetical protein